MWLIDNQGRLFGIVNAVDVLVALVVLSVATVGILGVTSAPSKPGDVTERTDRRAIIAAAVPAEGDVPLPEVNNTIAVQPLSGTVRVQDTYLSFTPDGRSRVVVSVRYQATDDSGRPTTFQEVTIETSGYKLPGTVLAHGDNTTELETEWVRVRLAVPESGRVSHVVEPDTAATVGDWTVATIRRVREVNRTDATAELVDLRLRVRTRESGLLFGGQPVRVNNRLTVVTEDAVVSGRIYNVTG